jgi:hypothetical protein
VLAVDRLACVRQLADTCLEWMNGVQFYLRRPVRMVRGHTIHIDTEWALTSISQIDVWRPGTMDRYGPQTIQSIVSVDVSDWDAPAPDGRTATEHSREEIGPEVWRQLKRSLNVVGEEEVLRRERGRAARSRTGLRLAGHGETSGFVGGGQSLAGGSKPTVALHNGAFTLAFEMSVESGE